MPPKAKHASLGASSSDRWMNCTGSPAIIAQVPKKVRDKSSVHADEGTAAHDLAEKCLTSGKNAIDFLHSKFGAFPVDVEMATAVQEYVDVCRATLTGVGGGANSWVECRINLAPLDPPVPMYGTTDFASYNDVGFILDIVDLKFGRGVLVEVENNPQLKYYAVGTVLEIEKEDPSIVITKVRVTIVQPRADHPDGSVRTVEYAYSELLDFTGELLDQAEATLKPDAPRVPGDWCRWCPAAAICPEKAGQSLALAKVEFAAPVVAPPEPSTLTVQDLAWLLDTVPAFEAWLKSVRTYATNLLETGGKIPGHKLVDKRADRKWKDEAKAVEWAEKEGIPSEQAFAPRKLLSMPQMEKLVGKKFIPAELYHKKSSGVTLAPESDKRPAAAVADFDKIEN